MTTKGVLPIFNYVDSDNKFKVYSNHTGISLTNFDVRFIFGQIEAKMEQVQPAKDNTQELTVIVEGVVNMSPLHAKLFCVNLQKNLDKYEEMFGKINLPTKILAPEKK